MKLPAGLSSSAALAKPGQNWSISPQMGRAFALFNTPIGTCSIAWGQSGIIGLGLPDADTAENRASMSRRFPGIEEMTPAPSVSAIIEDIRALLAGEPRDMMSAELDYTGIPDFHRRVYEVSRAIPPGQTLTYGQVSQKLNAPGTARAVGQALGANPFPIVIPCHRILAANGGAGGFSAPGGLDTKMKILNIERRNAPLEPSLFDDLPLAPPPRRPNFRRRFG